MKVVNTEEYLSSVKEIIHMGHTVSIPVAGNSMLPFLVDGRDWVLLSPINRTLQRGDIVLFQRAGGQFVLHRICKVRKDSTFYIIGDAQQWIEGPVGREQIAAVAVKVQRKGKWIGQENFWWAFFQYIWIRVIPLRGYIRKLYGICKGGWLA